MGRTPGAIAAATISLLLAGHAAAQMPAPTSPPTPGPYPAPRCTPPKFQVLPQAADAKNTSTDAANAALYQIEVKKFNGEAEAYHACLKKYIDKATGDAQKIQGQADAEVKRITDKANASVGAIRDQINKANADINNASTSPESLGPEK